MGGAKKPDLGADPTAMAVPSSSPGAPQPPWGD